MIPVGPNRELVLDLHDLPDPGMESTTSRSEIASELDRDAWNALLAGNGDYDPHSRPKARRPGLDAGESEDNR